MKDNFFAWNLQRDELLECWKLMAFNRNGHFQISKKCGVFYKVGKFLEKSRYRVSALYTCCVANKRSIFSSLILIFETLWLLGATLLLFFNWTSQIQICKISFFTKNKVILSNSFFQTLPLCKDISHWKCEILWLECDFFISKNKLNWENKVNKVSFEIHTVENNYRNM